MMVLMSVAGMESGMETSRKKQQQMRRSVAILRPIESSHLLI
jgi:hypothetical protein